MQITQGERSEPGNGFHPQLVLRYGATFPELTFGKGKNKARKKDYQNLVYDLSAAESFNQGLIKGMAKEHLELPGGRRADRKVKVTSLRRGYSFNLQYICEGRPTETHTLFKGDRLSIVESDFEGVTVTDISASALELSNSGMKRKTRFSLSSHSFALLYATHEDRRHSGMKRKTRFSLSFHSFALSLRCRYDMRRAMNKI